ncbi:MAG: Hint domain-containing protein [Burkholderiaceae bacterium]
MLKHGIGCFVAGTLVHTQEGLKPIEQIKVGDWVLSRPENPDDGTETGYKRVTKTVRFEDKEVVRFWWAPNAEAEWAQTESVYVTPNHPVWLNPNGWVAMGRLHLPGKLKPETIHRGDDEWLNKELVLADGCFGAMLDVTDLYRTDRPEIAFTEEEDGWVGHLLAFSSRPPVVVQADLEYDYEKWGDAVNETRERYTTTVYNFEVENWRTYFVGKTGLWVHGSN